jgi:hypothetical protein
VILDSSLELVCSHGVDVVPLIDQLMAQVVIGLPKVHFYLSPQHGLSFRLVKVEQTSFQSS